MSALDKFRNWLRPAPEALAARRLFGSVMTEARSADFYLEGSVADTTDGRFDVVVLHLILMMRRLKAERAEGRDLAQRLFDVAFANFDEALRELGVGDLTVPKRIRGMAEAFYGRVEVYEKALGSSDKGAFADAVRRNVYRGKAVSEDALGWTCAKAEAFVRRLDQTSRDSLLSGLLADEKVSA